MKKCMVILSIILALCVFQLAGPASATAADEETFIMLAADDHPSDDVVAPSDEEGTVIEDEDMDEEATEGTMDSEDLPSEVEEEPTE